MRKERPAPMPEPSTPVETTLEEARTAIPDDVLLAVMSAVIYGCRRPRKEAFLTFPDVSVNESVTAARHLLARIRETTT